MDRDGWLTWKVSCCPELSAVAVVLSVDQCSLKSTDVVPLSWPSFTGCSSIVVRQERQRISSNVEAAQVHHLRKTTHMLIANRSNLENVYNLRQSGTLSLSGAEHCTVLSRCCTWGLRRDNLKQSRPRILCSPAQLFCLEHFTTALLGAASPQVQAANHLPLPSFVIGQCTVCSSVIIDGAVNQVNRSTNIFLENSPNPLSHLAVKAH